MSSADKMKTWTIKVDKVLDALAEQLVRELGYTSKAELVREAVREKILQIGLTKLNLQTLDRHAASRLGFEESLEILSKLSVADEDLRKIIKSARDEMEDSLLGDSQNST
ncbi:MAG: ribbon-helix-helix domain-containing protein [Promethearchaeota archaeon]